MICCGEMKIPEHQQLQQPGCPKPVFRKQKNTATLTRVADPTSLMQRALANPGSLSPGDVLQLQRTVGNRAVGKLLSLGNAVPRETGRQGAPDAGDKRAGNPKDPEVVQCMISTEKHPKEVYMPDNTSTGGEFGKSLEVLLGNHTIKKSSWDHFRRYEAFPDARWRIPPTALEKWASANLGRGINQEDRQAPPDYRTDDVEPETIGAVRAQFENQEKVYRYSNKDLIKYGANDRGENLLLLNQDMREAGDALPQNPVAGTTCVIQALNSFNINVPGGNQHSVAAWHQYCRQNDIDYRTDSHIIRLYVGVLGYSLVHNRVSAWNDIPWEELGNGNYLISSYPAGAPAGAQVGHMVGAVVQGGNISAVHDQQNLTASQLDEDFEGDNVYVRYIYKM